MNLLYITQFFSPTMGGAELVFYNWAEGMARRGHHVDVVSHRLTNLTEKKINGLTVHRIRPLVEHKNELPPSVTQNLSYVINAILKCSQIIRKKKIDIIHANHFSPVIAGSILSKIHNIPVITSIHDVFTTSSHDNWKRWAAQNKVSRISSMIGPFFEKITVKMPVDTILTGSNASKQDLINFNAKRSSITVIPYGIDLSYFDNNKSTSHREYKNYVLFIGRLVFYKNLDVVISSFKEVIRRLPDARLIVVGDGPMKDRWQRMTLELGLNQNIEFNGFISHEEKLELLNNCSGLLFPSLYEGFGLVILEAFAMNKPVLVADAKPFDEIVEEGVDGFMIPAYDSQKWSEKIIFLLSNKTICKNMGRLGRLKVEDKFNINNVLDQIESLYVRLCSMRVKRRTILKQNLLARRS